MADENDALLEAIDKLTEAVDGVEDAIKAHPNAETKAKITEYLSNRKAWTVCLNCSQIPSLRSELAKHDIAPRTFDRL